MAEYQNPNQDPDAQKRLIIVFALTFLAIIISQQLMERFGPKPTTAPTRTEAPVQPQSAPGSATPAAPPASAAKQTPSAARTSAVVAAKQASAETETIIENDLYKVTFTNRGAVVKSWVLKQHKDHKGQPLDMVHPIAAAQHGYPLSLFTYDETLRNKVNQALYVSSATGHQQAPATLTFDFADGDTSVRKSFSFDHSHVIKVEVSVVEKGIQTSAYPAWPSALGDQDSAPSFGSGHIAYQTAEKVERRAAHSGFFFSKSEISNGNTIRGPFYWAGVTDQYFAAIFLPDEPGSSNLVELHKTIPQKPDEKDAAKQQKNVFSVLGAAVGKEGAVTSERIFVGPKQLSVLQSINAQTLDAKGSATPSGPNLEGVTDFGFFGVIAKPLFLWLKWTHDHWIANWGWAIIILTIIINVVLFPLRYTSMKSALKQQKIAPEINAIKRKYQGVKFNDPRFQDQHREMQEVMKREGINQAAGCVPMLIQLPFLFAFYSMLSAVNELRFANWLWIKDLSSPDPYFILPISIVVSMFVMQRITPMTGMDPAQAKMMQTMMPLMMGFISFSLPAGLGVYWVAGNLIGFATQYLMNNSSTAREIREHLAKRDTKRKK